MSKNTTVNSEWKCIRCKKFPKTYTFKDSGYFLSTLCEYCFDASIELVRKAHEAELRKIAENASQPPLP